MNKAIRIVNGAGRWFPAREQQLRNMVEGFINNSNPPVMEGKIVSAIAPHAGFMYSGDIAGCAFRAIRDNVANFGAPETVVILGLSHRAGFPGVALADGCAIETPLGQTCFDEEAIAFLRKRSNRIYCDYSPHRVEHSAENEIPFAQVALPDAKLVLGLTGDHDADVVDELVLALGELSKNKRILVVASADMLHSPDYELVSKTDRHTLRLVEQADSSAVSQAWSYEHQVFCGITPVLTAIGFAEAQSCVKGVVLAYKNSGDDFPESRGEWVVGYGAAVFVQGNSV